MRRKKEGRSGPRSYVLPGALRLTEGEHDRLQRLLDGMELEDAHFLEQLLGQAASAAATEVEQTWLAARWKRVKPLKAAAHKRAGRRPFWLEEAEAAAALGVKPDAIVVMLRSRHRARAPSRATVYRWLKATRAPRGWRLVPIDLGA